MKLEENDTKQPYIIVCYFLNDISELFKVGTSSLSFYYIKLFKVLSKDISHLENV